MNTKTCTKCKETKSSSEFYKDDRHSDGLCSSCKDCVNEYRRNSEPSEKSKEYKIKYRLTHKKERKEYLLKTQERNKKVAIIYKSKHGEHIKEYRRKYETKRRKTDINVKLITNIRARINRALKENYKNTTTKELLGCSIKELKLHLKKKFLSGMTWKNHSIKGWHIDHIKPCASFDLSKPEEQKKCFHYSNLQPLWAKDNLTKGVS